MILQLSHVSMLCVCECVCVVVRLSELVVGRFLMGPESAVSTYRGAIFFLSPLSAKECYIRVYCC